MNEHPASETPRRRIEGANKIVRDYAFWTAGFGLLPLPLIDFAAITAIQVRMVRALADHYSHMHYEQTAWPRERTRALVVSLAGGAVPAAAGGGLGSLLKMVPVVGTALGTVTTPALAWASTIALGRVFTEHFESGGTLLNFNPEATRKYFYAQFEAARQGGGPGDAYKPEPAAANVGGARGTKTTTVPG